MKIKDIENVIEKLAPNNLQESYDNSGLLIGNKDKEIKKILITLDITERVIEEAIEKKCDLIISHHPLIFKGLKRLNGENYVERAVVLAIKNDIAIYSLHTNLDNVFHGVNLKISEILELKERKILKPKSKDTEEVGAGMFGYLMEEKNTLDFLKIVKEKFGAGAIKYTNIIKEKIQKVAICGGSGSFLLQDAIAQEADVFITSDFTYHQFFDADRKILIIDIGHYELEQFTKELILENLSNVSNVELLLSNTNTNPIKYL